ncbi:hypothetical protein AVEN_170864-1, partial [Araneus ventricosus]
AKFYHLSARGGFTVWSGLRGRRAPGFKPDFTVKNHRVCGSVAC